jgi:hypothetical protein
MENKEFAQLLIRNIPEIKEEYEKLSEDLDWPDLGMTIVLEELVSPFIVRLVNSGDYKRCSEVLAFLDSLYDIQDDDPQSALYSSLDEEMAVKDQLPTLIEMMPERMKKRCFSLRNISD